MMRIGKSGRLWTEREINERLLRRITLADIPRVECRPLRDLEPWPLASPDSNVQQGLNTLVRKAVWKGRDVVRFLSPPFRPSENKICYWIPG